MMSFSMMLPRIRSGRPLWSLREIDNLISCQFLVCTLKRHQRVAKIRQSRLSGVTLQQPSTGDAKLDEKSSVYGYDEKKRERGASGLHHINMAYLPSDMRKNAELYLKKYPRKVVVADGQKLARYLKNRGRPTERTQQKLKEYRSVMKEILREEQKSKNSDQQFGSVNGKQGPDVNRKIKESNYSYIRYRERETAAFVASRIQACYGVTLRVLSEIKKREPEFAPKTLLDFGSGLGTATWAANSIWGDSIKEYQCVDISDDMNRANQFLLRGSENESVTPKIPGIFFSKFLPFSHRIKYDIVIAAYTLSELPLFKQRKTVIDALWRKTNHFLVIIEPGNNEGFEISLQARDHVTKTPTDGSSDDSTENGCKSESPDFSIADFCPPGHVFSPCPHDSNCARSEVDFRHHPCNFDQKVELSICQKNTHLKKLSFAYERFSHIVLRMGESSIEKKDRAWPRLLKPVKKRKGHVICELCCENGNIERHILSKAKDKEVYKGVRHCSKWGDQLPPNAIKKVPIQVIEAPEPDTHSELDSDDITTE